MMINFNSDYSLTKINYEDNQEKLLKIISNLKDNKALGHEFFGWNKMLLEYDFSLLKQMSTDIVAYQKRADVMVVIGIGGSYLGSLALEKALTSELSDNKRKLLYVGNNLSSDYIQEVYDYCVSHDFVMNVVSKSGTTMETALVFKIFRKLIIEKYGLAEFSKRVIITSDVASPLTNYAQEKQMKTYFIPQDIGGRYSVFTPAGLLPLVFLNIDVVEIVKGAATAAQKLFQATEYNPAFDYALHRFYQFNHDKVVEGFISYEPRLQAFIEWIKQLFAESEGKNGQGLLPIGLIFTTDLHSLGQYIQDGKKIMFETTLKVLKPKANFNLEKEQDDFDSLNRLINLDLNEISERIKQSVIIAHSEVGQIPNYQLEVPQIDEYNMGYLMSFMMYACTYSAYLLGVNPFNQPGVEIYKEEIRKKL